MEKAHKFKFILEHLIFGYKNYIDFTKDEIQARFLSYKSTLSTHSINSIKYLLGEVIVELKSVPKLNNKEFVKQVYSDFLFLDSHKSYNKLNGIDDSKVDLDLDDELSIVFFEVDSLITKSKAEIYRFLRVLNIDRVNPPQAIDKTTKDDIINDDSKAGVNSNTLTFKSLFLNANQYNEIIDKLITSGHIIRNGDDLIFKPSKKGSTYEPEALRQALGFIPNLNLRKIRLSNRDIILMIQNTFKGCHISERTLNNPSISNKVEYYRMILS